MISTGIADLATEIVPCIAFAIAGPRPTNATPSLPVAAAYPMAIMTALVSWRAPTMRTPIASNVENSWQMQSLMRPNTVSTPRALRSSASTW
jgi:hypothetical protein